LTPTDRTLEVLEYLTSAGSQPVKQVDIVRDLGLSPATLNRIVRILSERGYVFRTSEKYLVKNFTLERTVAMSEAYSAELDQVTRELSESTGAAVEVVVVMGHELLWRTRSAHSDPSVQIIARPGFRRGLLEFDALSKLYLSTLEPDNFAQEFDAIGFFETGITNGREIKWLAEADVRRIVAETRGKAFACDAVANHMGVRRFATLINDTEGRFLHLLSVADNAPAGTGEGAISREYKKALLTQRDRLSAFLANEKRDQDAERMLRRPLS